MHTHELAPAVVAARAAMARLAPRWWTAFGDQVTTVLEADSADGYRFSADGDRLLLSANGTLSLVTGFRDYLESVGCGHISRCGSWERVPQTLPLPKEVVSRQNRHRFRYSGNVTVAGYTSPYWQWPQWERELDLLAASGVNIALNTVGAEAVWLDTFTQFGYGETEILSWISLPAHQPWQWLGNLAGYGGGIPRGLLESRAALGRRIVDRMRELGIEPVLPGFSGLVPTGFAEHQPDAATVSQGQWCGFERPDWLDPRTGLFGKVAQAFHRSQRHRFGQCRAQAVDILHEGGTAGEISLRDAAGSIADAMRTNAEDYLWVLQAWQANPSREVVDGIDTDHLLLLDLADEKRHDRHRGSWVWGPVTNFGGRSGLFGSLPDIAKFPALLHEPTSNRPAGTGHLAEGSQTNPVVWSLLSEITWHDSEVSICDWISDYVRRRYGTANPSAVRAWQGLLATAYRGNDGFPGGADSVLCAVPDLTADKASIAAPSFLPYPPEPLEIAWRDLLSAGPKLSEVDTYGFDLIDLTRQVIGNRGRVLLPSLRATYAAGDRARFDSLCHSFLELFDLLDPVLATRREFLLGPWLAAARALGEDEAQRDALEFDARTLISTWGDTAGRSVQLRDYANREWSGLVLDLYRPRWERYLASLSQALRTGTAPEPIDFYADAAAWARRRQAYPTEPDGPPYAAARAAHHALPYFEGLP